MSTDFSLSIERNVAYRSGALVDVFSLETPDTEEFRWFRGPPLRSALREGPTTHEEPWIKVAEGFYVKKSEYQRRFGEIDLDYYRQRMSPRLFAAFVRHMGVVPGSPELDVVELTKAPDY